MDTGPDYAAWTSGDFHPVGADYPELLAELILRIIDRDMSSENKLQRVSNQRLFIPIVALVPFVLLTSAYIELGWSLSDLKGQIYFAMSALLLTVYWWLPFGLFPKSHKESIEFDRERLRVIRGEKSWTGRWSEWQAFKVEMVISQVGYNCCLIFYGRDGKEFSFYFRNLMASEIERFLEGAPLVKR